MDIHSQISEKIREMSEHNERREQSAKEAEKKLEEGYTSEPVVEQVKPKPKKKKKSVSVQKKTPSAEQPTGDMEKVKAAEPPVKGETDRQTLSKSMDEMEKLMNEAPVRRRETVFVEKEEIEAADREERELPAENGREEKAASEEVKKTVKENPRHKGLHSVQRRHRNQPAAAEVLPEKPQAFCLYEPLTGTLNELKRDVTIIGRSDNAHIRINNRFVSGIHARVSRVGEDWFIEDLGSTNGTKVNGKAVEKGQMVKLEKGDNITLAATKILFDIK